MNILAVDVDNGPTVKIHSTPLSAPQRLRALKRKDVDVEAVWRSSGRHSQVILGVLSPPTLSPFYLESLLTPRKEAHL